MRILILAAVAAFGLGACEQQDTTVDERIPATADYPPGVATNANASTAPTSDPANVNAVDGSVGP